MPFDISAILGQSPLGGGDAGSKEFGSSTATTVFGDVNNRGRFADDSAAAANYQPWILIGAFVVLILAILLMSKR